MKLIILLIIAMSLFSCKVQEEKMVSLEGLNPFPMSSEFSFLSARRFENVHFEKKQHMIMFNYKINSLTCPDGRSARFRLIVDKNLSNISTRPLVYVFHGGSFDLERTGLWKGSHITTMNKLTQTWGIYKLESFLGVQRINTDEGTGSIAGSIAQKGWSSVYLENCWGDLGHNRSYGDQENDFQADGFYRAGLEAAEILVDYFSSETSLVQDNYAWGVSAGGHAVYEIANSRRNIISKIVLDSPADDIAGFYNRVDSAEKEGKISTEIQQFTYDALDSYFSRIIRTGSSSERAELSKHSLAHKLEVDPHFLDIKTYYIYGPNDPVALNEVSAPAAKSINNIIQNNPSKAANFCLKPIDTIKHVFTNDSIQYATQIVSFLTNNQCI